MCIYICTHIHMHTHAHTHIHTHTYARTHSQGLHICSVFNYLFIHILSYC